MRFSHPIVAARRAKPAMANQSNATVCGADGGNHFLCCIVGSGGRFRNCRYKPAALAGEAEIDKRFAPQ